MEDLPEIVGEFEEILQQQASAKLDAIYAKDDQRRKTTDVPKEVLDHELDEEVRQVKEDLREQLENLLLWYEVDYQRWTVAQ